MTGSAVYTVLFYVLAIASLALAFTVVTARKLLRAAVALMMVLSLSAGFYLMLAAEFLAGIQVLVYVGGIVILIVFAVMLTRTADLLEDNPSILRKLLGLAASFLFFFSSCLVFYTAPFLKNVQGAVPADNVRVIGRALMNYGPEGYVLPFEVISLLLLAAVIGGIVIARKTPSFEQPFTSGGDLPGEVDATTPFTQDDPPPAGGPKS